MSPIEIIDQSAADGLALTVSDDGNIKAVGDQELIEIWLPHLRKHKAEIIVLLKKEFRQQRVLEMLATDTDKRYAVIVDDATTDPVTVTIAIKGIATFDMQIPKAHYDGLALLEVIEQHSTDTALNLSGDTYPLPDSKERNQAHPGEPQRKAA